MKEITTCEVVNIEDKKQMTIITEWLDDDELKIILLRSGMTPLIGETTITKISESFRSGKTREESRQEIRNELSGIDKDVQFLLRETKLTWKKKMWKKGTVELQPVEDAATLGTMSIEWLSKFSTLHRTTFELQEENESLKKKVDELIDKFKEMERIKNSMEDTLYKQFLLLLNSKKKKIRELEDKLASQEVSNNRSVYEENTDESGDEQEEYCTSTVVCTSRKRPKQEEISSPVPSTSKRASKSPLKLSQESDDEIILRYDESQIQDLGKLNTEEDPEDDIFSQ